MGKKLTKVKHNPDQGLIEQLEQCLDDAKAGRMVEYRLVARLTDANVIFSYAGSRDTPYRMMGIMVADLIKYAMEEHIDES